MKEFTVAQVLAVYHDRLTCDFDAQRELIDHLAGTRVPIWDIPVVLKLAHEPLAKQFPWLKAEPLTGDMRSDISPKFVRAVTRHAKTDTVTVKPLPKGAYVERLATETLR